MVLYSKGMPKRTTQLITTNIYHIYNRAIDKRTVFRNEIEYKHAIKTFSYYLYSSPSPKLSSFLKLSEDLRTNILNKFRGEDKKLIIPLAFCLMPNHFHFLIIQSEDGGISKFAANFQNSYAKYFNTKYHRVGPIFLPRFKAVRMEDENQLLHVSRYIHLNPYSSGVVKTLRELSQYRWSSLGEYLSPTTSPENICDKTIILNHFKRIARFRDFVFNQAGYQRSLKSIRNSLLETKQ